MGCDIHAYIEVEGDRNVSPFATLRIQRNYLLFAALAGVRNYGDEVKVLTPPKGIPAKLGYHAQNEYYMYVNDGNDGNNGEYSEHEVDRSTAEKWITYGSIYLDETKTYISNPDWHTTSYLYLNELIAINDNYKADRLNLIKGRIQEYTDKLAKEESPGWKKLLQDCLDAELRDLVSEGKTASIEAVIAAMQALDNPLENKKARFTFWFDN